MTQERTSPNKKARQLAKYLLPERPDYAYLKKVFYYLRQELSVTRPQKSKPLPRVPAETEIQRFYDVVWQSKRFQDMVIIKLFLYTGVRVGELVHIRLDEVDFQQCQIRINKGKGGRDRIVPFPSSFKEALAMHAEMMQKKKAVYLFESSWKRRYSERGIRQMLARYAEAAGLAQGLSPHKLRHFFLLWLKKQGIDDAFIQPYSGHQNRQSLEVYSRLALTAAQKEYDGVMGRFPI